MTNTTSEMFLTNNSNVICIHNSTRSIDDCYVNNLNEVEFSLKWIPIEQKWSPTLNLFQAKDDLLGYAFSIGALFLSAFGSVLTKKITSNFDKVFLITP